MKNVLEKIKFYSGDRKDSIGYYIIDIVDEYIKYPEEDYIISGRVDENYIKIIIMEKDGYFTESYYHHHDKHIYDMTHRYLNNYLTTLVNKRKRLLTIDKLIS